MSDSDQCPPFNTPRLVLKKVLAKSQQEGDGAVVRRGIGRYLPFFPFFSSFMWLASDC